MNERTCKKCTRTLPVSKFPPDNRNKAGYVGHIYTCYDCQALRRAALRAHPKPAAPGERRLCRTCGKEKALSAFFRTNSGGREHQCKKCKQARQTELRNQRRQTDPEWTTAFRQRHAQLERLRRMRRVLERRGVQL